MFAQAKWWFGQVSTFSDEKKMHGTLLDSGVRSFEHWPVYLLTLAGILVIIGSYLMQPGLHALVLAHKLHSSVLIISLIQALYPLPVAAPCHNSMQDRYHA
jgi:hypothetical protein